MSIVAGFTPLRGLIDGANRRRFFVLTRDLRFGSSKVWSYRDKTKGLVSVFLVPSGNRTDLASVPKWLRPLAPSWWETAAAGVLHDFLYETGLLSRLDADRVFYEALRSSGVSRRHAWAMSAVVRLFGGRAWRRYRALEALDRL